MFTETKLSHYIVASDILRDINDGSLERVIYSTRTCTTLIIPEHAWRIIKSGRYTECPSEFLTLLNDARILVPKDEDELAVIVQENKDCSDSRDQVLYQVVQPSAWCQLECNYCGQQHSRNQLSVDAQDRLVSRIKERLSSGNYKKIEISWFGAEPLAGIKVIRRLSKIFISLAQINNCDYSARIVTNGVSLTRSIADELVNECRIMKAEVTLDGLDEFHDLRRITKRNKGSFQRIFTNILNVARDTSIGLVIRCNVDSSNVEAVAPLIQELARNRLQQRLRFYTAPVHSWGNDAHMQALTKEEYADWEIEWIALQSRLGFSIGLLPARKKIVCMAVRENSELLDANDNSYNCTEVSYVPIYGEPNIYATRLPGAASTRVSLPAETLSKFNNEILSGKWATCNSCRMLPVCGGQCPKSWHEGHEPCPAAKLNMPQRLNILYAINESPLAEISRTDFNQAI